MEIIQIITLAISGLLLVFVGLSRLTNPVKTYDKNSGISLSNDVNLLNEVRGVSGLMLSGGIIVLLATILPSLRTTSFAIGTLIFLGFALGRIVSRVVDGKPNKQLISGLIFELVFGGANTFCLFI